MLSRCFTCYALQHNTASIMNIEFNYVFVSVCKVNLSAQLLHVVMVKKCLSKVDGTQLQERSRSGTRKAKGWKPLLQENHNVMLSQGPSLQTEL